MSKINKEIRKMLDADYEKLEHMKNRAHEDYEDPYKYGNDNHQEVVEEEIPEWARKALSTHKPGDQLGEYHI